MINLMIVDLNEKYCHKFVIESMYKKADSIVLVYDITNKTSFEECKTHYKKKIKELCEQNIKVILVGNKKDLESERQIDYIEASEFAKENNYLFMEVSCLNNENVYEIFETITEETLFNKRK